jgi:hypothetical protein
MIKKIFIYLFSPTPDFKLLKLINSESDILNKHLVAFFGSRCPFIDDNKKNNINDEIKNLFPILSFFIN